MKIVGARLSGVVVFVVESPSDRKWLMRNAAAEPWQWLGTELVVDARSAGPIAAAAAEAGLLSPEAA